MTTERRFGRVRRKSRRQRLIGGEAYRPRPIAGADYDPPPEAKDRKKTLPILFRAARPKGKGISVTSAPAERGKGTQRRTCWKGGLGVFASKGCHAVSGVARLSLGGRGRRETKASYRKTKCLTDHHRFQGQNKRVEWETGAALNHSLVCEGDLETDSPLGVIGGLKRGRKNEEKKGRFSTGE